MDSTTNPTQICSLPEAARRFNLDSKTIGRLRRILAGRHIQTSFDHTLYYRLSDIERAMRVDAANRKAMSVMDHLYQSTVACGGCGAPMPRLWFVDRCSSCGKDKASGGRSHR